MAENGTIAYIDAPKLCDYHKREAEISIRDQDLHPQSERANELMEAVPIATYDLRTKYGYWANCCEDCAQKHAMYPGLLGIGKGQKLELRTT